MRPFFFTLLILLSLTASGQDALFLGGLDVSAYPELQLSLRLARDGNVVYPLDPNRLIVRENGRLLAMTLTCPAPMTEHPSLAIGFERSLDDNFPKEMSAARAFLSRMGFVDDGAEASLWSFATTVDREVAMTRDSARLRSALDGLSAATWPLNGTALYETMHRAIEDVNAAGSGTRKAIVFFTDGYDNTSWYDRSWDDVRGRAVIDGIRIYVVLVKNRVEGEDAMRTLTAATGGFMVYESDARAVDSVYRALIEPDPARLWCEATGRSPFCANGEMRELEIGYVLAPGDTLWTATSYQAPYLPNDLLPLAVWCSPAAPLRDDTVQTMAIGVRLDAGLQPPPFSVALPLGGMRVAAMEAGVWPVSGRPVGGDYIFEVDPPATGLTDGYYTIARLVLEGSPAAEPWQPLLIADPTGCLRLESVVRPATARAALDTVLTARRSEALLPLRIAAYDLPEGVQHIDLEIRVDTAHALFDAITPLSSAALPAGWSVRASGLRREGREQLLSLSLGGPRLDQPIALGAALLRVRGDPAYLLPVRLTAAQFNSHADAVCENGLLVIRDSCRNNVVALSGLSPAPPWPQPARESVTLRLSSLQTQMLRIIVTDDLGRTVLVLPPRTIVEGLTDIRIAVSPLESGSYSVHYVTAHEVITQPLLIVR
ncbi:MAG: VWA domain-containing protein [Bacteroidetes bacterium]|nr:VWA domain-containing protein [Bacteroidota bacterium]